MASVSLLIDIDDVERVLLADGWHNVVDRSFTMDAYEYVRAADGEKGRPIPYMLGGVEPLLPATGFEFRSEQGWICGPITAILAVQRSYEP